MQAARHDARMPHKTMVLCPSRRMACVGRMVFCGRWGEHPLAHVPPNGAQTNLRAANLPVFNLVEREIVSAPLLLSLARRNGAGFRQSRIDE